MGGQTFHARFSMTMENESTMTFTWQMSMDGETWTTLMEGTSKKKS